MSYICLTDIVAYDRDAHMLYVFQIQYSQM